MKGLPEKMGLPEHVEDLDIPHFRRTGEVRQGHLSADAELSALLETLDALERQATAGEWALIPQSNGAGPMLAHPYATGKQMNPTGLRLIAHMLQRGDSLAQDKANAGLIVALRNGYPLLRERLSAALLDNQRVRKETIEECARVAEAVDSGDDWGAACPTVAANIRSLPADPTLQKHDPKI